MSERNVSVVTCDGCGSETHVTQGIANGAVSAKVKLAPAHIEPATVSLFIDINRQVAGRDLCRTCIAKAAWALARKYNYGEHHDLPT